MRVTEGFPITLSVYSTAVSLSKSHNAFQLHGCCIIYLTLCLGERNCKKKKKISSFCLAVVCGLVKNNLWSK